MHEFADRRTVLRSGAAAGLAGLAGCLGILEDGDGPTPDDDGPRNETQPDDDGEEEADPVESWPMFQYDARNSGHAPGRGPGPDLSVEWTFEGLDDVGSGDGNRMRGGPVISEDGTVYLGAEDGGLYALDISDGSVAWSTEVPGAVPKHPLVHEDSLIVTYVGGIQALDRNTADVEWEFEVEQRRSFTTPVVHDGCLAVGTGNKEIYVFDVTDGEQLWKAEMDHDLSDPAAITEDRVYICDWTKRVHVLDADTGADLFSSSLPGAQLTGATVVDGLLYIGDDEGNLSALDTTNFGETAWMYEGEGDTISTSPAVADGRVFVDDGSGNLCAIEEGEEIWNVELDSALLTSPAMSGETIYVGTSSGTIEVIERNSGSVVESVSVSDSLVAAPSVYGKYVLACSHDGVLHAVN